VCMCAFVCVCNTPRLCYTAHDSLVVCRSVCLSVVVRIWRFSRSLIPVPTYHSDASFHYNKPVAFGRSGVRGYNIPGKIVNTFEHFVKMSGAEFWKKKEAIIEEWNKKSYSLANRNCNHFVSAVLKMYGMPDLPGGYFSRGDHLDKQVWNWAAQGLGLSPEQADSIGKEWCNARDSVKNAAEKVVNAITSPFRRAFHL